MLSSGRSIILVLARVPKDAECVGVAGITLPCYKFIVRTAKGLVAVLTGMLQQISTLIYMVLSSLPSGRRNLAHVSPRVGLLASQDKGNLGPCMSFFVFPDKNPWYEAEMTEVWCIKRVKAFGVGAGPMNKFGAGPWIKNPLASHCCNGVALGVAYPYRGAPSYFSIRLLWLCEAQIYRSCSSSRRAWFGGGMSEDMMIL